MKLIRRREYYSRRVKADFAPMNGDEKLDEDDTQISPEERRLK
jgi:hypothetical protein